MDIFHQLLRTRFFGSLFITLIGAKLRENPMFFFIAGVQPKTVTIDGQARRCPSCGLEQAVTKRVDHYLSLFFLPLVRLRKGSPFLQCQSCGSLSHESGEVWHGSQGGQQGHNCSYCGKRLEPGFRFCPFCGKSI